MNGVLIFIAVIVGYLLHRHAKRWTLPSTLILFITGAVLQVWSPGVNLEPFLVLSLALVIFDAGARFVPRKFDSHAMLTGEFILLSLLANIVIFNIILHATVFVKISALSVIISALFGVILTAVSHMDSISHMKSSRLHRLTLMEDHLSNPMVLFLGLLLLSAILGLKALSPYSAITQVFGHLLIDMSVGIFIGILMMFVHIRVFRRRFASTVLILASFSSYFLSQVYGSFGFISALVSSLFFHNAVAKNVEMDEFGKTLSGIVHAFIFIAMGYLAKFSIRLLVFSIVMYLTYLLVRHVLLVVIIKRTHGIKLTLDSPKGTAMGAFASYLLVVNASGSISELEYIMYACLLVVLISNIVAYAVHFWKE